MRRHGRFPSTVAFLLAAVLDPAAAAAIHAAEGTSAHGEDWPRFLGPRADGKSRETAVRLDWAAGPPEVRWHVPAGEGYSGPVVAGGKWFLFDRHGGRARLTCRDAETGEELWRSEYDTDYEDLYGFSNGPRTTPVVDGDRVYTFGPEGRLRCLRTADGRAVWEVDTTSRYGVVQNFFGVGSTPVVEGGLLIVAVGGSPEGSPSIHSGRVRGDGSGIVAFDKRTGKQRWAATDELASYSSPVVVDLGGRRRGLWFARGGLVAFAPATGEVDFVYPWRAGKLQSVNASNPVVAGDRVLISESYGPGTSVLRVGKDGYEVEWKDPPRGKSLRTHWMTPIHHEGFVYASSGSGTGDAELRAVDLATGEVKWSRPGLGRSTLLYVAGHLVVLTERGELVLVRATPERYDAVAEVVPGDDTGPLVAFPAWSPPALSRGLLHVRGKDRVVCLDVRPTARPEPEPEPGEGR